MRSESTFFENKRFAFGKNELWESDRCEYRSEGKENAEWCHMIEDVVHKTFDQTTQRGTRKTRRWSVNTIRERSLTLCASSRKVEEDRSTPRESSLSQVETWECRWNISRDQWICYRTFFSQHSAMKRSENIAHLGCIDRILHRFLSGCSISWRSFHGLCGRLVSVDQCSSVVLADVHVYFTWNQKCRT